MSPAHVIGRSDSSRETLVRSATPDAISASVPHTGSSAHQPG